MTSSAEDQKTRLQLSMWGIGSALYRHIGELEIRDLCLIADSVLEAYSEHPALGDFLDTQARKEAGIVQGPVSIARKAIMEGHLSEKSKTVLESESE
jgi:hypothetical protein